MVSLQDFPEKGEPFWAAHVRAKSDNLENQREKIERHGIEVVYIKKKYSMYVNNLVQIFFFFLVGLSESASQEINRVKLQHEPGA